jgi:hypothetical protein
VLGSELIYGGSFVESCRRINEMLMLAKGDEFEPERLACKIRIVLAAKLTRPHQEIDQRFLP